MKTYFNSIYGNADGIRYFTDAIESGKLAHAYILEGPAGSGKKTFAKAIAAERVKSSPFAEKIIRDASPDLSYFGLIEKKKTVGVDTIRALKNEIYIKPSELEARFFILTDCHLMTEQAQNAALKFLEEPPKNVYFFLCTDSASALLPTIRSRAQTIRMQIFSDQELSDYALQKSEWKHLFQSNPMAFSAALRTADGRIGKLEQKKEDKDALLSQSKAKELIKLLDGGQYLPLLLYCNKAAESRPQLDALLQKACHGLRDALAIRKSPQIPLLFFATVADAEEAAEHLSDRSILALITEIKKIQNDLAGNPNLKGTLAMLADTLFRAAQN